MFAPAKGRSLCALIKLLDWMRLHSTYNDPDRGNSPLDQALLISMAFGDFQGHRPKQQLVNLYPRHRDIAYFDCIFVAFATHRSASTPPPATVVLISGSTLR